MVDKSEVHQKRCRPDAFARMALLVLGDENKYEDELIEIKRRVMYGEDYLDITRKPMSQNGTEYTELLVDNPVTMLHKGKIIRHHGEHTYLTEHLEKLVDNLGIFPYLYNTTNKEDDNDQDI